MIEIKDHIPIPKYKQIVSSIESALESNQLKKNDQLPSVNEVSFEFSLSRDTVLQGYNELKKRGIIHAIPGKGYFVKNTNSKVTQKIFLLFDELNAFKENLYNAFIEQLESQVEVDIYFHHFNIDVFNNLITNNNGSYNYYVIMPANLKDTRDTISDLPKNNVIILDQFHEDLKEYSSIYQNFKVDMYKALRKVGNDVFKYQKIVFIYDKNKQPEGMLLGIEKFCNESSVVNEVVQTVKGHKIDKGTIYIIPDDRNLILIIKKIQQQQLVIGEDIGIISYNETLLKEIVANGITTISTDFEYMGKRLALIIQNKEQVHLENPSSIIIRNSL